MQGETKTANKPCQICFEKTKFRKINCGFCDFYGCSECVKQSILFSNDNPKCPKCNHMWNLTFCVDNLTKSFMTKEYKAHKKNLLFDIEKSKIPNTMNEVHRQIQIEEYTEKVDKKYEEWVKRKKEFNNFSMELNDLKATLNKVKKKNERKVFKKRCPSENCQGFLSSKYKCLCCNVKVCSDCYEIKEYNELDETHEHVCNPDNVASYKAIKEETKGCPKCAVPIFKISGCDQMWCVECKVAFSWKSGKEVMGVIHNPHFYEWKKNNKAPTRNVGEILCGGLPEFHLINRFWKMAKNTSKLKGCFERFSIKDSTAGREYISLPIFDTCMKQRMFFEFMTWTHRHINHFQHYELDNLRRSVNIEDVSLKSRIDFIRGRISEKQFKTNIMKYDRKKQKSLHILHIYEMFYVTILERYNDIFHTIDKLYNEKKRIFHGYHYHMQDAPEEFYEIVKAFGDIASKKIYNNLERMNEILNYCNKELYKISKLYNMTVGFITQSYYIHQEKYDDFEFLPRTKNVQTSKWCKPPKEEWEKHANTYINTELANEDTFYHTIINKINIHGGMVFQIVDGIWGVDIRNKQPKDFIKALLEPKRKTDDILYLENYCEWMPMLLNEKQLVEFSKNGVNDNISQLLYN